MAWHLLTQGDDQNSNYMEFLIDSDSDINNPPAQYSYALSSIAHTPGYAKVWEADASGNWIQIVGGGAGSMKVIIPAEYDEEVHTRVIQKKAKNFMNCSKQQVLEYLCQ